MDNFSYFLFVIVSICKYPVIQPMAAMVFIIKFLSIYLSIPENNPSRCDFGGKSTAELIRLN